MKRISVITPVFNQREYIEATIESVLSQKGMDVEYIIMDGGSTDGTVDVIRRYEKHLAYWQSQPDGGQTQALVKGFERATGDILCFINGDDTYEPQVFSKIIDRFQTSAELEFIYGDYMLLFPDGRRVAKPKISYDFDICLHFFLMIPQPASFWTRRLYNRVGGLNPRYQFSFDYEFFLRVGRELREAPGAILHVPDLWAVFRLHQESKTVSQQSRFQAEDAEIRAYFGVPEGSLTRKALRYYHGVRTLWRYYIERGWIPLRKDQ